MNIADYLGEQRIQDICSWAPHSPGASLPMPHQLGEALSIQPPHTPTGTFCWIWGHVKRHKNTSKWILCFVKSFSLECHFCQSQSFSCFRHMNQHAQESSSEEYLLESCVRTFYSEVRITIWLKPYVSKPRFPFHTVVWSFGWGSSLPRNVCLWTLRDHFRPKNLIQKFSWISAHWSTYLLGKQIRHHKAANFAFNIHLQNSASVSV